MAFILRFNSIRHKALYPAEVIAVLNIVYHLFIVLRNTPHKLSLHFAGEELKVELALPFQLQGRKHFSCAQECVHKLGFRCP